MGNSWSGLRRELENDYLCESLQGRVQYFLTHYHKAPDDYGRVAVRVDGKEILMGNPYNYFNKCYAYRDHKLKNKIVEATVNEIAVNEGVFEIYDITDAIMQYKNSDIKQSICSSNPLVRMFATMDRRVGKRSLMNMISEIDNQPEWLQFFYRLRLESENLL